MVLLGRVLFAGLFGVLPVFAGAETRWCAVRLDAAKDKLNYPPIARAARVSGVVIGRMMFRPTGEVVGFEKVSGPELLFAPTREQMKQWTVATNVQGGELCQSLAVISFTVGDEDDTPNQPQTASDGLLRISVHAEPLTLNVTISDPAPYSITRKWLWFRITHRVR